MFNPFNPSMGFWQFLGGAICFLTAGCIIYFRDGWRWKVITVLLGVLTIAIWTVRW